MSMQNIVVLNCDKCAEVSYRGTPDIKARAIRAAAKKDGWKLGKKRDLCPKCSAELSEAVKTLLAS